MEIANSSISPLMEKLVWQMTGRELYAIAQFATESMAALTPVRREQAIGIHKLAEELGCSVSILYELKKKGVLDDSIISHIGKKVVFDVEKARELANQYQREQRSLR